MLKYNVIILALFSIVLWACRDTSLLISTDIVDKTEYIGEQTIATQYGNLKRIAELERMYCEIEQRKNQIEGEMEYMIDDSHYIIINNYYHTQVMILNEIHNQWK